MKAKMLKIAGVKSEAAFYKKFPNQEAFMKVHGKEFKKAQIGASIDKAQNGFVQGMGMDYPDGYSQAIGGVPKSYYNNNPTGFQDAFNQPKFGKPQTNAEFENPAIQGTPYKNATPADMASRANENIGSPNKSGFTKAADVLAKGPISELAKGYDALRAERAARKQAEQNTAISDITRKASATREEQSQRKYVRPEDIQNTGEEFFPIYGVGTNALARNGGVFQGGGEIQNTYDGGRDIYTDSGYEPLNESNQKSFQGGGYIQHAQNGFSNWQNTMSGGGSGFSGAGQASAGGTPWGEISHMATGAGQSLMGGQNAGGQIGGTVGGAIGSIFGPGGKAIGEFVGGIGGNLLDTNIKKTKKFDAQTKANTAAMAFNSGMQGIQQEHNANVQNGGDLQPYEDGGWVSHNWTPQVIASFGDHSAKDVYDFAHEGMDTLRAGGHLREYTPPSEHAMETYAMGGQLKTHWGGEAETVSHNPYLPGSGETVAFRGQSHTESDGNGKTGIGITYGDNPVEVERGEPMFEMQDGGQVNPETGEPEKTGVVFGNMEVNKNIAKQFDDPELMAIADKYHGKKFKNIGLDLSKDEAKQNKIMSKNTDALTSLKVNTPFDKLKMSSYKANLEGADKKLKELANTKITLANYQNAINDTKEEISQGVGKNISAEHLAKGLIQLDKDPVTRNAKWGDAISKAQSGINPTALDEVSLSGTKAKDRSAGLVRNMEFSTPTPPHQYVAPHKPYTISDVEKEDDTNKFPWQTYANQALNYLRPSDQEAMDYEQLYPEMYAMASNQLEPVPSQFYQPELNVPYDISLQAQRNAVTAGNRALTRQLGYNPSAQANAAPAAYNAMNEINQAEFQANQANKNQVYAGNRATMNQAQMTNLGIASNQWDKQALAKSNTKATTQAALSSMADKYAKHKLENKTLGIYENMYNYRFGKDNKADNWNPLQQFNTEAGGGKGGSSNKGLAQGKGFTYDENGNIVGVRALGKGESLDDSSTETKGKNGSSVKKNYKNSSVVRAYKNL